METSPVTGQNIAELFELVSKYLYLKHKDRLGDFRDDGANELKNSFTIKNNVDLYKPQKKKKKCC